MSIKFYSGSASSAAVLFTVDATDTYREDTPSCLTLQITSAGTSCTVTYEQSIDGTNWFVVYGYLPGSLNSTMATTSTVAGIWTFPILARFFRARVSTYGSGTVSALATTSFADGFPWNTPLTQSQVGGGSQNPGNTVTAINSAATTNATVARAAACNFYSLNGFNQAAYDIYFKVYNKNAAPTVGTDVPFTTFRVPTGQNITFEPAIGKRMSSGLAFAITKLGPYTDTTAVAASDFIGFIEWS